MGFIRYKRYRFHHSREFLRRAKERKLFASVEETIDHVEEAVKRLGILVSDFSRRGTRFEKHLLCILRKFGVMATVPIVIDHRGITITTKTIFASNWDQRRIFKVEKQKLKERRGKR